MATKNNLPLVYSSSKIWEVHQTSENFLSPLKSLIYHKMRYVLQRSAEPFFFDKKLLFRFCNQTNRKPAPHNGTPLWSFLNGEFFAIELLRSKDSIGTGIMKLFARCSLLKNLIWWALLEVSRCGRASDPLLREIKLLFSENVWTRTVRT